MSTEKDWTKQAEDKLNQAARETAQGLEQGYKQLETKAEQWGKEIELEGKELVVKLEAIIKEGNAKAVIIRDEQGEDLLAVNLNVGVVAGGVLVLTAPVLAAIAALAALVAKVRVEIVPIDQPTPAQPES